MCDEMKKEKHLRNCLIKSSLKVIGICILFTGTVIAADSYRLTVDCFHSRIRNTGTGDRITATFMDANSDVIRSVSKNGIRNCARGDAVFSISTDREVRFVDLRTNGNDAYYIDEWRLFKNGALIKREGVDNGMGWCLSTDPRDAAGTWRNYTIGLCRTWIKFS